MTTTDQLSLVDQYLGDSRLKAISLADGGLIQGWVKSPRLLVIVQHASTYAIFVFISAHYPVTNTEDLSIESIIVIDQEFRCEIDTGEVLLIKMTRGSQSLMFEMVMGYHTQNIVSEIFRIKESKSASSNEFNWISKYVTQVNKTSIDPAIDALTLNDPSVNKSSNTMEADSESPDSSINRQEIANMDVSPIAARESIVKYQMSKNESFFTHINTFKIFVGTWNVNGQAPDGDVKSWLASDPTPPDLYVIGFQELDLSKEAFVFNESIREEEWVAVVTASLHPNAIYKRVKLIRLVGMMLLVYVKQDHAPYITNVHAETVGTGIMGKLGNKGGVGVRLEFHNTSICFVNSHLAAHVAEFERRNQDYHDIVSRLVFPFVQPPKAIKDHDMVYWLGDLNYRITDLDAQTVKDLLRENRMDELMKADQFYQQRLLNKAFVGYEEGNINFIPTYKFDPGTDNWDSSEKCRAPAWTDRILWRGKHIEQKEYRNHMDLKISDHKPVSAIFSSGMKVVDPAKYRKVYEDVMKRLDRLENEFLPQVSVDTTEVIFDTIKYYEQSSRFLTVANTGQVPVNFEFINKLNDKSYCKPWLSVDPSSSIIMPGETCNIALEIFVDKKTAGGLTSGQDQMYDILVLHLAGGKDIFITVSGTYQKSCFGASINALCKMNVPISELSVGKLIDYENDKAKDDLEEPYPVPKELWFLCDLMTTLGLDSDNLFLQNGLRSEILKIRDWLDTGLPAEKPKVSINSAAEALLIFLETLREPIIPFNLFNRCLEVAANYLQCKQVVTQMPFHHKKVFIYMTGFLREVIRHPKNGLDPKLLSTLFSGIFLRDPPGMNFGTGIRAKTNQQILDSKKQRFLYHFLVNEPDDQ